ncbi:MAG: glutamate racemase [Candidatus Omnitrophota bacterium]
MAKSQRSRPIGIFDSGLGGLTVFRAVSRVLPREDIIYFGDTARVPYGIKSRETIIRFSHENAALLMSCGVKALVVACNSSSSHALSSLGRDLPVPVLGVIRPGVRRAVEVSRSGRIGVIATQATVSSHAYRDAVKRLRPRAKVVEQACPLFVPLVEEGWFRRDVTRRIAAEYLRGVRRAGIDTLILGCTHYPLLKTVLRQVLGQDVVLIDSAEAVARDLAELLEKQDLQRPRARKGRYRFYASDEPRHFQQAAKRFLQRDIKVMRRVTDGNNIYSKS